MILFFFFKEYSEYVEQSGLHGALCVLESGFTADSLANLLQIPAHKSTIRKHLASEFSPLLFQARYVTKLFLLLSLNLKS